MPNIDSSHTSLTDSLAGAEGSYPAGASGGDRVQFKLEYTPEELGYERGSRNLPRQITLTDDQIEEMVLRQLGLDVKDPADYKLLQQRLKTSGSPYAQMDTSGSNLATYNARTGRYELNVRVERSLYLKLKGRAVEAQSQLELERRRTSQPTSSPSDTVAGNQNIDTSAYDREKLNQLLEDARILPSTFGTPSRLRDLKRASVTLPDDGKEITPDRALLNYIQQRYGGGNLWGPDIQDIFELAKQRGVRVENLQVRPDGNGARTAEFDISVENLLKLHHTYLGVQDKVNADIAIFEQVRENNELNRFVRGVFNGAWASLKGSWETITDPVGTINNIREAVGLLLTLSPSDLKTIAANLANDGVEWAKNATPGEIAEKAGEIIGAAAVEIILGKGAGVALRALRGTKAFASFINKTKAAATAFKQSVGNIPVPTPGVSVLTDTMGNRLAFPNFEMRKLEDIISPLKTTAAGRVLNSSGEVIDEAVVRESREAAQRFVREGKVAELKSHLADAYNRYGEELYRELQRTVEETVDQTFGGRRTLEVYDMLGGHTDAQHIGKSVEWLKDRLAKQPSKEFVSSFYNRDIANRAQLMFVRQYKSEIEAWLKSGSTKPFVRRLDVGEEAGIVVGRGKQATPRVSSMVEVAIAKDKTTQGWHIVTAYPVLK